MFLLFWLQSTFTNLIALLLLNYAHTYYAVHYHNTDAMNGLPGMIGSGMPETYELLRLLRYVSDSMRFKRSVSFPVEFSDLLDTLKTELAAYERGNDFKYWDAVVSVYTLHTASVLCELSTTVLHIAKQR
jgi:hypothetical protein